MWELIKENQRKSWIIFIAMGVCLILLGYIIGLATLPPDGGAVGAIVALGLWIILSFVSFYSGDSIILAMSNAREVTHDVHPQLFNIVEEMKLAANLPVMPRIYIINDPAPNAFATGRGPGNCAIAVTAGLLARLNRDELQGVIAHEMSHIVNRDVAYVTFAGVMLGSIIMLSEVFLRGMFYSSNSNRRYSSRSSSRSGGQAQAIILIIAVIFAILAPILARIFYFALSRKREYLADASGVRLTRYPEGLASALENIAYANIKSVSINKVTAPMFIVNPLEAQSSAAVGLFSTHPPIESRVKILRSMSQGVNYANYQKAYSQIIGKSGAIFPAAAQGDSNRIPVREASVGKPEEDAKHKARTVGDLMRAVNNYAFLICACGLKIKVPPEFNADKVSCPRCGRELVVPVENVQAAVSVLAAAGVGIDTPASGMEPLVYNRKGSGWESLSCSCGKMLQISPMFSGNRITCQNCGRITEIRGLKT